ncbi:NADP-dependent oxidoreductase [Camelimonas abortus]|uniref:NADP-dependent oxidoreductase n=1 Tax=Camelimonas abortus TaxID=1017184 RepID=A0ABV7LAR4_9HYPH
MSVNRQWVLRRRPQGAVARGDLELVERPLPALADGEVLCRTVYLSLDPTHRIWMSERDQYMPPVEIGQPMRGGVIAVVEDSRSAAFRPGDIVRPHAGAWADYTVAPENMLRRLENLDGAPLTAWMSVLGNTGVTAWFGMMDIGQPKPGEIVVVSAAAGAVGSVAAQLAKLQGARVVGIAGGPAKCAWLRDGLKLDGAIDYRNEDVGAALDRLCPDGVDVNFENVGGAIMEAVFSRMNSFGRMPLCGLISAYNQDGPVPGPSDFSRILMRRLTVKGFIVLDYFPRLREAMDGLIPLVREGRLKWKTHVVPGLENAADSLNLLFSGGNDGKLLVQVSPEPQAKT